jgi:putative transcriptional regulator
MSRTSRSKGSSRIANDIRRALEQAVRHVSGEDVPGLRVQFVPNVAAIRHKTGLTQRDFAAWCRISIGTLRNWEQGRSIPDGPALSLLQILDAEPEAAQRALAISDIVALTRVVKDHVAPLDLKAPNAKTQAAMREARLMMKRCNARLHNSQDL